MFRELLCIGGFMKKSILFLTILAVNEPVFSASLESLNKEQFVTAFVNKTTVSLATDVFNGQVVPNTFSYYLDDKGNMQGKFGAKPKNGPQADVGNYKIEADGRVLCTWKHWYNGKTMCFQIFNTENAYISVDCNNIFHTAYLKNAIKEGNHLD